MDLYNRQNQYDNALEIFKTGYWRRKGHIHLKNKKFKLNISDKNKNMIIDFLYDCRIGKTGIKGRSKKSISANRCYKYLSHMIKFNDYFKKDFDKIELNDTEKFIDDLNNDKFCMDNGKGFSEQTKLAYKISLIKLMKWLYNSDTPPDIVGFFDLTAKDRSTYIPSYKEINEVLNSNISLRDKFIIRVLSDGGCRLSEFAKSRIKDYEKFRAKDGKDYYKHTIHDENSKTYGRTIILKHSTEIIDEWFSLHPYKNNPEALIVPAKEYLNTNNGEDKTLSVEAFNNCVKRNFVKVLGIDSITPKVLRKTSATEYGNNLTHAQMCYRYGWVMGSKQPQRYINRSGISEENNLFDLNTKNIDLIQTNQHLQIQSLKQELEIQRQQNNEIREMMKQMLTPQITLK